MERVNQFQAAQIANWPIGSVGFFVVDNDAGDDNNLGFSSVSMALAGATPLKTLEELQIRVPTVGKDRRIMVALKPRAAGATYRNKANSADALLELSLDSYRYVGIRGSSDFSDDAADKILAGGILEPTGLGPNVDSSWTVATGSTISLTVAAGLTTGLSLRGTRIRFKGNITAGLANECVGIQQSADGITLVFMQATSVTPVAGDEFFIEKPGVVIDSMLVNLGDTSTAQSGALVGIHSVAGSGIDRLLWNWQAAFQLSFMRFAHPVTIYGGQLQTRDDYPDQDLVSVQTGYGVRAESNFVVPRGDLVSVGESAFPTTSPAQFIADSNVVGAGSIFTRPPFFDRSRGAASDTSGQVNGLGETIVGNATRTICDGDAGVQLRFGHCRVKNTTIINQVANGAIVLEGVGQEVVLDDVDGTSGNTDVGVDLVKTSGSKVHIGRDTPIIVSGTVGDIRLAEGALLTYLHITRISARDSKGNRVYGTSKVEVGDVALGTNADVSALGEGEVVRVTGDLAMKLAQADSALNAASVWGICQTAAPISGVTMIVTSGYALVKFTADPTVGNVAYLDEGTAGLARDTTPPTGGTNQKVRLGRIVESFSGAAFGIVDLNIGLVLVAADGTP